ncbi:hypothetical protein RND71_024439 [Anisodus tanguticus]|uniref:Uncharacterized protein n=1 Tax=Anisodus tanguticus TaxID=243964 RepID=A0AAE1RPJ2_9SOLA|nr:hypothetical protein RND71_024439 [Anisodus tanguticus]
MAKAYLRKLEEYQTAKAALETGASLAPGESRFTSLIIECDERIAEEAGELPNHATVETSASVVIPAESKSVDIVAAVPRDTQMAFNLSNEGTPAVKPKYRHEFYQKPEEVVVTIFAKGIPAKNVSVDFGEQILSVSIDIPGVDAYSFQPRLFSKEKEEKLDGDAALNKFFRDIYKDADKDARRAMMKSFEGKDSVTAQLQMLYSGIKRQLDAVKKAFPRKSQIILAFVLIQNKWN